MHIRNFTDKDILTASKLAKLTWGDFYLKESIELQNFIYSFMVEYYDLNRTFSFSCVDDEIKGFILGFTKNDSYESSKFEDKVKFLKNVSEQKVARDLFKYLEMCGNELKNRMNNDDIILGLFVSIQKGCGKQLLLKLIETCKVKNIKNIYLWSDTTCDYEYYKKNNFVLLQEINSFLNGKFIKTLIYKKSI